MVICPICNAKHPDELIYSDDYHYSGLVICPSCKKTISPVREQDTQTNIKLKVLNWKKIRGSEGFTAQVKLSDERIITITGPGPFPFDKDGMVIEIALS